MAWSSLVPETAGVWVPEVGFRWVKVRGEARLEPTDRYGRARLTLPMREEPMLCRAFAALDASDPAAILAFANRHGSIGAPWAGSIGEVRDALRLLDEARAEKPTMLQAWIDWRAKGAALRLPSGRTDEILFERANSRSLWAGWYLESLQPRRRPDRRRAALLFAQRIINRGLEGRSTGRVLWSPSRSALELRLVPDELDLLGVLWAQVAEYAQGELEHRPCAAPGCDKWFPVAPGLGRSDKATCGGACQKRLQRAAKETRRRRPA